MLISDMREEALNLSCLMSAMNSTILKEFQNNIYESSELSELLQYNMKLKKVVEIGARLGDRIYHTGFIEELRKKTYFHIFKLNDCFDQWVMGIIEGKYNNNLKEKTAEENRVIEQILTSSEELFDCIYIIKNLDFILSGIINELLEPLPEDVVLTDKNQTLELRSCTPTRDLESMSKDLMALNDLMCAASSLNPDSNDNRYYIRRVETGSLSVIISSIGIALISVADLILLLVHFLQKEEYQYWVNQEKKMNVINNTIDAAKKILDINPENHEADEIIQKAELCILDFLDRNPKGTVNGTSYDTRKQQDKLEFNAQEEKKNLE